RAEGPRAPRVAEPEGRPRGAGWPLVGNWGEHPARHPGGGRLAHPRAAPVVPGALACAIASPATFLLVLAYDGTDFHGWQIQPGARTVQGVVLDAARRLAADAKVIGASRTDAGVHALRQVASLTMSTGLAVRVILRALNAALPHDVRAREVREAPRGFDARRAALGKRYAYLIDNAAVPVGRGARAPEWLQKVLDSRDRRLAGATAPAQGLTLVRVLYPNFA